MKFKKRVLSFFFAALVSITGCSKVSFPTNANTAFKNFTLCLFKQEVASNTINLHYSLKQPEKYGISDVPITLGSFDFDKTSSLASIENLSAALHKFSYKTLSEENKLTYDILDSYLNTLKTDITYFYYDEPLSPVTGIHAQLPVLLAEYQLSNKKEVETYLALLQTLPDYFSSLINFEQRKSEAGLFMSDTVADEVIEQCNAFVSMGESNYLLSTFYDRIMQIDELSDSECSRFIKQNQEILSSHVIPAYESLATELSALKGTGINSQGLCYLKEGKEYYSHLVAAETGSNRSISELKSLIQNQIATDLLGSQQVLNNNPDILKETSASTDSADSILNNLETKISGAFPSSASVNVEIKYVPTALEEYLSPAFYLIPAIDNFNDNTIYINGGYSLTGIDLFTTLAHEGYPGHLYQTTYFANTNPDPLRNLLDFPGYVEGWATYGGTALCYTDCCSEYKSNKFSNSSENLYLITMLLSS